MTMNCKFLNQQEYCLAENENVLSGGVCKLLTDTSNVLGPYPNGTTELPPLWYCSCENSGGFTGRSDMLNFNGYQCHNIRVVEQIVWSLATFSLFYLLYLNTKAFVYQARMFQKKQLNRRQNKGRLAKLSHAMSDSAASTSSYEPGNDDSMSRQEGKSSRYRIPTSCKPFVRACTHTPFVVLIGTSIGWICLATVSILKVFSEQVLIDDGTITSIFNAGWVTTALSTVPVNTESFALVTRGIVNSTNVHRLQRIISIYRYLSIICCITFVTISTVLLVVGTEIRKNEVKYSIIEDESMITSQHASDPLDSDLRFVVIAYNMNILLYSMSLIIGFKHAKRNTLKLIGSMESIQTSIQASNSDMLINGTSKVVTKHHLTLVRLYGAYQGLEKKLFVIMLGTILFSTPFMWGYQTYSFGIGIIILSDSKYNIIRVYLPVDSGEESGSLIIQHEPIIPSVSSMRGNSMLNTVQEVDEGAHSL